MIDDSEINYQSCINITIIMLLLKVIVVYLKLSIKTETAFI
jgi:hypothetical protein